MKTLLTQFGCTDREAEIYIESLKLGPSTVQELARSLGMNRVTVHSAIEQLILKGLLFETRRKRKRLIAADSPSSLERILQQKYNDLKVIEQNLPYTMDLLSKIQRVNASRPTVKFYEGVAGFKQMLEESLEAKEEVRVFNSGRFVAKAVGMDYLDNYMKRRGEMGIEGRLMFPNPAYAKIWSKKPANYRAEVRVLEDDPKWIGGFFAWNHKIALLSYGEGQQTCTILENEGLAYFFKEVVFEMAWEKARPA